MYNGMRAAQHLRCLTGCAVLREPAPGLVDHEAFLDPCALLLLPARGCRSEEHRCAPSPLLVGWEESLAKVEEASNAVHERRELGSAGRKRR